VVAGDDHTATSCWGLLIDAVDSVETSLLVLFGENIGVLVLANTTEKGY